MDILPIVSLSFVNDLVRIKLNQTMKSKECLIIIYEWREHKKFVVIIFNLPCDM